MSVSGAEKRAREYEAKAAECEAAAAEREDIEAWAAGEPVLHRMVAAMNADNEERARELRALAHRLRLAAADIRAVERAALLYDAGAGYPAALWTH